MQFLLLQLFLFDQFDVHNPQEIQENRNLLHILRPLHLQWNDILGNIRESNKMVHKRFGHKDFKTRLLGRVFHTLLYKECFVLLLN